MSFSFEPPLKRAMPDTCSRGCRSEQAGWAAESQGSDGAGGSSG